MPFFCAVPPTLPADPEGVVEFPGAGPYYVAEYRPGQRVVIRRNRFYRGTRPHHVDGFDVDLTTIGLKRSSIGSNAARPTGAHLGRHHSLRSAPGWPPSTASTGRNSSSSRGSTLIRFSLNTSRPLFRDNPRLRQAVNFAIDRRALARAYGAAVRDAHRPVPAAGVSRIQGRAHLSVHARPAKARALARVTPAAARSCSTRSTSRPTSRARRSSIRTSRRSGSTSRSRGSPPAGYFDRLAAPGEPFDIALYAWSPDYLDPFTSSTRSWTGASSAARTTGVRLADVQRPDEARGPPQGTRAPGRTVDSTCSSPAMRHRASPSTVQTQSTLVSRRVGCVVLRPDARSDRRLPEGVADEPCHPDPWSPAPGRSGDGPPRRRPAHDAARRPRRQRGRPSPCGRHRSRQHRDALRLLDPALAYLPASWRLIDTTCARLMTYPDKPPPEGYRLVPEVAAAPSERVARREDVDVHAANGFRFSDGTPVRASAFARAIAAHPGARRRVGRRGLHAGDRGRCGRAGGADGVPGRRRRSRQPAGRQLHAAGPRLPGADGDDVLLRGAADASGRPGGSHRVPGRRPVLRGRVPPRAAGRDQAEPLLPRHAAAPRGRLRRRPHHDRQRPQAVLDRVERGEADWGWVPPTYSRAWPPARRQVRHQQVAILREAGAPPVRLQPQHVAPAVSRQRAAQAGRELRDRPPGARGHAGGPPFSTPPTSTCRRGFPGFRDARIYPFTPDLAKARALARGHTRDGKVILYTSDIPLPPRARADRRSEPGEDRARRRGQGDRARRVLRRLPARTSRSTSRSTAGSPTTSTPSTSSTRSWTGASSAARTIAVRLADVQRQDETRSPPPRGSASRAYAQLDAELSRDAAPLASPSTVRSSMTLVSRRMGCIVLRPDHDLTAVCLKE